MNTNGFYYCPGAGKMRGMRIGPIQRIKMKIGRRRWLKEHPQGIGWRIT